MGTVCKVHSPEDIEERGSIEIMTSPLYTEDHSLIPLEGGR
jgi:hypothetical protein